MNELEALFKSGVEHHQAGRLVVAKAQYEQIIARHQGDPAVPDEVGDKAKGVGNAQRRGLDAGLDVDSKPRAISEQLLKAWLVGLGHDDYDVT